MRVLELCYVILTLVATKTEHVACDFTVTPKNTCAMQDEEVELQCSLDTEFLQNWIGPFQQLISDNNKTDEKYQKKYTIVEKYNLQISHLDFNDAGTYMCKESFPLQQFKAEVIVLESSQRITSNAPGDLILENEIITYVCEVRYSGNIIPSMKWTLTSDDTIIDHKTNNQPGLAQTNIDVTGDASKNGKSFMCTYFFEKPDLLDDLKASNAPDCTMNTSSGILTVHYKPRNTKIILPNGLTVNSGATVYTGDVLACQADSNPKPMTYEWIAEISNRKTIFGDSQTVTLQEEQSGITSVTCIVTNYMGRDSNIKGSGEVVVILNVIGMHGEFVTTPDNTCINLGMRVELKCGNDGGEKLGWILPNRNQVSVYPKVSTKRVHNYPLMVSGQFSEAGTYTCMNTRSKAKAELIVLGPIKITTFHEGSEIQEGDPIRHTCTAKYAGSFNASFEWWSSSGDDINTQKDVTTVVSGVHIVTSHIEIKADKLNYSCKLFFSEDDNKISGQDVATNVPDCFVAHALPLTLNSRQGASSKYQQWSKMVIIVTVTTIVVVCIIIGITVAIRKRWFKRGCKDYPQGEEEADFSCDAPRLWNDLPDDIRTAPTISTFRMAASTLNRSCNSEDENGRERNLKLTIEGEPSEINSFLSSNKQTTLQ